MVCDPEYTVTVQLLHQTDGIPANVRLKALAHMLRLADVDCQLASFTQAETIFRHIDVNQENALGLEELRAGLSDFGIAEAKIDHLFFALDANSDNKVS